MSMRYLCRRVLVAGTVLAVSLLPFALAAADGWPGWRGPTGQGVADEKDLPLTWGGKGGDNVLWKVPLPGTGTGTDGKPGAAHQDQNQSSPIVCRDRVLVTASYWPTGTTTKDFPEHHIVCYRADNGKQLWDATVAPGPWLLKDLRGGYTAPTPASDGQRVYVLFGSAVLAALDLDGKPVWRHEIKPHDYDVAIGNSPVVYRDCVLLMCDQVAAKSSRLLAFDGKSGRLRWEKKRPTADWTHSTPVVATVKGKPQLLVAAAHGLEGLDPDSGERLWWCDAPKRGRVGDTPSPVLGQGQGQSGVVYADSGRGGPAIAVDPTGTGDVSRTHLKWKVAQVPEGFSSPVVAGECLYRLHNPGILKCWKLVDGQQMFAERLNGVSTTASLFVTADGRIYCASAGKSYVIKAGPKLEVLAVNDLGDDGPASAAVAGGRIYLKGRRFLYCVGKK
jgi:outer membrane protein assembly factor BamB